MLVAWVYVAAPLLPVVVRVIGSFVKFEASPLAGIPKTGVIKVGLLLNTTNPVPVSFVITPANWAEVVAANCESGFAVNPIPEGRSPRTKRHAGRM